MTRSPAPDRISSVVAHTRLEDGRAICIRAVTPDDEERLRDGIDQLSQQSRYLRFFSAAPTPPDQVIEKLVAVDGHLHLAWGAILKEHGADRAIGVVHAIRSDEDKPRAEFAIGIVDAYHGLGLARMLTAVLLIHCAREGIAALDAQVLAENARAISFIKSLGGKRLQTDGGVADFSIGVLPGLAAMRASEEPAGLGAVFEAFAAWL